MTKLFLIRLPVDLRAFTTWALERGYLSTPPGDGRGRPRNAEMGYALHAALTGLFGTQAPRPFTIPPAGRRERWRAPIESKPRNGTLELLGYAPAPVETLRTLAELTDLGFRDMIDWEGALSKPMPDRWPKHLRLRFELRACPVRRIMKPFTTRPHPDFPAVTRCRGKEVDAYEVAAARSENASKISRDQIYIEWLAERLAPRPERPQAVTLLANSVRVEAYRSVRLLRRPRAARGGRKTQWLTRPEVRFTGLLEIVDPAAFPHLLATGVGRHCGFGFGMLLLKPA